MSVDQNGSDSNGNRATVALVDAKLDGLKDLMRAEFANVREDVKPLLTLVVDVGRLRSDHDALDRREIDADKAMGRRVSALESSRDGDKNYRRIHLPTIALTCVLALVAIIGLITQLHG